MTVEAVRHDDTMSREQVDHPLKSGPGSRFIEVDAPPPHPIEGPGMVDENAPELTR